MTAWLTVVGIGEDGWSGLSAQAQRAVENAATLFGGERHMAMIPPIARQSRIAWPSPFSAAYDLVRQSRLAGAACVLASGDPMHYGVGCGLARRFPPEEIRVLPAPSAFSLAAARLGWPLQDTTRLTIHGRPVSLLRPHVAPGARLMILSEDGRSPYAVARLLVECGYGPSALSVLERMSGPYERRIDGFAAALWSDAQNASDKAPTLFDDLNLLAVECRPEAGAPAPSRLAGLPDSAYRHDGQLTKRDIRAITLARLAPTLGEVLWDVGAGCGSIAIEWMRSHTACRAFAVEAEPSRQALIRHNAEALGVPTLEVIAGAAPDALEGLPKPDAVFIGGGLTHEGVLERCWTALKPGGRLVANAVTVQGESCLTAWRARVGGELARFSAAYAAPLGGFDGWRPALPITLFSVVKS